MSDLGDKLLEIKRQKDEYILPENIKKDITVYGVTGTLETGSGSGDVKLFETVEEMQQDTTAQEGDLAVVYRKEFSNINADSVFNVVKCPLNVVLPTAVTSSMYCMFRPVEESAYVDIEVSISSSSFSMSIYNEEGSNEITYISNDGISYTRTDSGDELINIGTDVVCYSADEFNNVFGYFMQCESNYLCVLISLFVYTAYS